MFCENAIKLAIITFLKYVTNDMSKSDCKE